MSKVAKKQIDKVKIRRNQNPDPSKYNPLQEKIDYLEARIKMLDDICSEINPYATITNELKMKLLNFNILELNDPFKVTNALLMLLEDTMDELHVIKPFNDTNSTIKEIL